MEQWKLTEAQKECLRNQTISDHQPGPVLRDFRVLLDYLRPEGVEAAGKHNLLPIKIIGELDSRLSRPLRLELTMKRPQIRSHPYLQGLNLLLRASALSRVEGAGDKARLVLDPEMMVQWDQLNPTEQYFHLLEAWLTVGSPEMVGEKDWAAGNMLMGCLQAWQSIPDKGLKFKLDRPDSVHVPGINREFYKLALMDLFGLVRVDLPDPPVMPWVPAGVHRVPFGDAVFALLYGSRFTGLRMQPAAEEDEDEADEPFFGAWRSLFQPYFPEWRNTLELPEDKSREGTFIFRVSLGKTIWRRLAVASDDTLDDLASYILESVNFDSDHLYEFVYRNHMGATDRIVHPYMEEAEGPSTDQIAIGDIPLEPGQTMLFRFDFGDNWRLDVKLERIEPPGANIPVPSILERHGESPEQYPDSGW